MRRDPESQHKQWYEWFEREQVVKNLEIIQNLIVSHVPSSPCLCCLSSRCDLRYPVHFDFSRAIPIADYLFAGATHFCSSGSFNCICEKLSEKYLKSLATNWQSVLSC